MDDPIQFPNDFLWGAATSAYQIEGSPLADGAAPSIWERFVHSPGLTASGDTGDLACDHYRRYRTDVKLMADLGLNAYRFSVAWARVLPGGRGRANTPGLDFYQRLVDALLEQNIQPLVTLYHWDLPAALDDLGGWLNPDVASWFADYAQLMYRTLGDRVSMWVTLNEPWVITDGGYLHGTLAPGHRSLFEPPIASHNLLRAHGAAVQAYRAHGKGSIGLVVNLEPKYSASDSPEDLAASQRADAYMNRQYLDPVFLGSYPSELADMFGSAWPSSAHEDMQLIQEPFDFLGINYYTRCVSRHDPSAEPFQVSGIPVTEHLHTETGWEVFPPALTRVLLWVKERYGDPLLRSGRALPLYITENGAAFYDPPTPLNGKVEDPLRVHYYREHLRAAHEALCQGVDLRGYFAWSLLDNFEWSLGYAKRFGLYHVDYETQRRTAKASARFYAEVIRSRGAVLSDSTASPPSLSRQT